MARYVVSQASDSHVSLLDSKGRHHLARSLNFRPLVGAEFHGAQAANGFAVLTEAGSVQPARVIFVQLNCSPQDFAQAAALEYRAGTKRASPRASGSGWTGRG
jgi:hypothetical protein